MPSDDEEFMTFPESGCFGCSQTNPSGLHLRFQREGEEIRSTVTVADHFHGAPGVAHGGIVATLLDEISCAVCTFVEDRHVVTGELTIRYERPVPVDVPLLVEGRIIDRSHPRYFIVEATIHQGTQRLARSSGKFFVSSGKESVP